jgi:FdhD protein
LSTKNNTEPSKVLRCLDGACPEDDIELIGEEPFLIRIDSKPYSVVMRTPGNEIFHAAGFCLGEGIVDSPDDFIAIGFCEDADPNVIDIRLKPERREKIKDILERKSFVSQTSCGICGKEMIKDLNQVLEPADSNYKIEIDSVFNCIKRLSKNQKHYKLTRGSHASLLFDEKLKEIAFAEDVGRHNGLDKAIGNAFMNKKLFSARVLILSSRISYELIQKTARARIPIMISHSRPTALAVKMGRALNMTLACPGKGDELLIFCGENRIIK